MNMALRPACFTVEAFSGKKKTLVLGLLSYKVADYKGFLIVGHKGKKEFCCISNV